MKRSRILMGLVPPSLCAAMVICILAAYLFNRHNHRFFDLGVLFIIAPYVVVGVISYLVRNVAIAFVCALLLAIAVTIFSPLPALLFYDGTNAVGLGMGLGLGTLLRFVMIGSAIGAALVIMLVHKLWQLSMIRPAPRRVAWGTVGAVLGALGGTAVVVVMKLVAFDVVRASTGAIAAGVVGAMVGGFLWGMSNWPARTLGGGLGGAVGGLFVVLLADDALIAGADWAFYESFGGALPGVVTAALVGAVVGTLDELLSSNQANLEDRESNRVQSG